MWLFDSPKQKIVSREDALPGREARMPVPELHTVLKTPLRGRFAPPLETIVVGMGCFWGAEKAFWKLPGVFTTAVGYAGGFTPNPTYREVCTGGTGHTEVVLVVYDPNKISTDEILRTFWESHDPTQGMRQGNDVGTQYRSAIYWTNDEQKQKALASRETYAAALQRAGLGAITTELRAVEGPLEDFFYYAEDYHQQYLDKNPDGYCGLGGTGVSCPVGVVKA